MWPFSRKRTGGETPGFLWRGVLIVVPVLALTGLGLYSLRQDRSLAEAEARERAHALAEQLADEIETALKKEDGKGLVIFEANDQGELIFPPPVLPVDRLVPLPTEELSADQAQLWSRAQAEQWAGSADAAGAYQMFLELKPPARFAAAAHYGRAVSLRKQGQAAAARAEFQQVASTISDALAETGVSYQMLAQMHLLELAPNEGAALARSLGSNAVSRPTVLTTEILRRLGNANKAAAASWLQTWEEQERARELHRAARLERAQEKLFWVANEADEWLVSRRAVETNRIRFAGRRMSVDKAGTATNGAPAVARVPNRPAMTLYHGSAKDDFEPLQHELLAFTGRLPPYFAMSLEVAGRPIISTNHVPRLTKQVGKGSGQWWQATYTREPPPVFAAASRFENGTEYLRAGIHLIGPELLYERQQDRAVFFSLLLVVAAGTVMFGYVSSLRAFRKQQRLAVMKSNFVSSVSHELRAPIASVRLMAEGLERGTVSDPGKQQQYFGFIVQECRRLSALIENVLDFARIEQGRKEYEFEPADLPRVVYQAAGVMKPPANEKRIELRVVLNEAEFAEPAVLDARAIQQALINLIDNAIKHSPAGSTVEIGVTRTAEGIQLWVEDQGAGIPRVEHPKIFERFYRSGSELRRETQGVGIGLSIVKHIVEAHGGTVTVQSEVGAGSRFTLEIPLRPREVEVQPA